MIMCVRLDRQSKGKKIIDRGTVSLRKCGLHTIGDFNMYSYCLKSFFHNAAFKCFVITHLSNKKVARENTLEPFPKASLLFEVQYEPDALH